MFQKGYVMSEEHKRKIGLANSISKIGGKQSVETIRKRVAKLIGKKRTEEQRALIRLHHKRPMLGRVAWNRDKKGEYGTSKKGKTQPNSSGDKHWAWRGGVTANNHKIRQSLDYKIWRNHVFQRDDYTCQACGERGGKLNADHELPFALFPDLRFEILNGRTFCVLCHKKTDTYGRKPSPWIIGMVLK